MLVRTKSNGKRKGEADTRREGSSSVDGIPELPQVLCTDKKPGDTMLGPRAVG